MDEPKIQLFLPHEDAGKLDLMSVLFATGIGISVYFFAKAVRKETFLSTTVIFDENMQFTTKVGKE